MADKKFSNISGSWSINYVYTQPYSTNPAYDTHMRVAQELLLLDEIDRRVANTTEFPDVIKLLEKIK